MSVSAAGDVNGDGIDDVLLGAPGSESPVPDTPNGAAYIVYGRHSPLDQAGFLWTMLPAFGGDGTSGTVVFAHDSSELLGTGVAGAGDVNADGLDDILIGGPGGHSPDGSESGVTYVLFGRDPLDPWPGLIDLLFPIDPAHGFILEAGGLNEGLGTSVSGVRDINNDGFVDFAVGAVKAVSWADPGRAYVLFGHANPWETHVSLSDLLPPVGDGSDGFPVIGDGSNLKVGQSVAGIRDFDGDGLDDVAVGAPRASPYGNRDAGVTYVVFGRAGHGLCHIGPCNCTICQAGSCENPPKA